MQFNEGLSVCGCTVGTLAVANSAVYMVGSAFKELDGSLVAETKCAPNDFQKDRENFL